MHSFIVRALYKTGLINKIRVSVPLTVNQKHFSIPVINGMGHENIHQWELWMCHLLKKILPLKEGVFIDVGVNIGQTLLKLRSVDGNREYVGFEPNPHCIYYAEALIKGNGFVNCRLIPVGLLDRDAVLELNLYADGNTDSQASLIAGLRPDKIYRKIFVPVFRYEQLSSQLNIPAAAIFKIDVEGAELEVLQSLEGVLVDQRPMVLIEILPCYEESNIERVSRQQQMEALIKKAGYRILRIITSENGSTVKQLLELDTIGIHSNRDWCEYLLLPNEMSSGSIVL